MEKFILGTWSYMPIGSIGRGVYHADGKHYDQPFRVVAESTHEALREQWIRFGNDLREFDKYPAGYSMCPNHFYEVIVD